MIKHLHDIPEEDHLALQREVAEPDEFLTIFNGTKRHPSVQTAMEYMFEYEKTKVILLY